MNAYILYRFVKQMKKALSLEEGQEEEMWKIEGGGVLFRVLKKMFKVIDRLVVPRLLVHCKAGGGGWLMDWRL